MEQGNSVFIESADVLELIEAAFPCIVEEGSSGSNEDGNEDDSVFDQDNSWMQSWVLVSPDLLQAIHHLKPSGLVEGAAAPLYLVHRVFRI